MKSLTLNAIAALSAIAVVGAATPAWAQHACTPTSNQCPSQNVTTSHIQIGGAGALSSAGASFSNPARLDDGTIAEAEYSFSFDRTTGRLTYIVTNTTSTTASLTAIGFNATTDVTSMALISANTINPNGPTLAPWQMGFDRVRTDNIVNVPPNTKLKDLRMDGFGALSIFFGNKGIDTGGNGGNTIELKAGKAIKFVMQVTGNLSNITACSFTSVGSYIPPGNKIVTAVGRFQAGVNGGSAFIGPCTGGSLVVKMAKFTTSPSDSSVGLRWSTATEVDNAGFRILRRDLRTRETVALNDSLITALGSPVSGADYSFTDTTAVNGRKYAYMVEDWDIHGVNNINSPEIARPNPTSPAIRLLSPADESRGSNLSRFRWEAEGRLKAEVQISNDALFANASTLRLPVFSGSNRSLSVAESVRITSLAADGADGGVYWRVVGRDARGQSFNSATYFLAVQR